MATTSTEYADFFVAMHGAEDEPLRGRRCPGYRQAGLTFQTLQFSGAAPPSPKMKHSILTIIFPLLGMLFVVAPTSLKADDSVCDYPSAGRGLLSTSSAGKAGQFRSFSAIVTDPIEKVVLWYAERLGLPKDHRLIEFARNGFENLERNHSVGTSTGHDTDDRQDHTVVLAALTSKISHVTFRHRPDFSGTRDVMISLTTSSGVTSITVIMPVAGESRKGNAE